MREEKIKNIQKIEQDTSTERKKKAKKGERAKQSLFRNLVF